jgi:CheY-like chemotaxis protein
MIALTDTGHGMPPEVIARAFEPFFTTKPAGHGTGLGLAQVYGFIKQSNGHVKIDSQQGAGTVVKIYLPRFDGPETTPALPAPSAPPTGSPAEIVLLVEDDEAVRLVHVSMLRGLNYTVLHAANGQEALDMLRTNPGVALLFTDIVMPGMSGQTLAEMARRQIPALKILYTTGYTASAIEANADLLQKPFSYDTLAHKLRTVLDRN